MTGNYSTQARCNDDDYDDDNLNDNDDDGQLQHSSSLVMTISYGDLMMIRI